jgi:cytochrome P450
MLQARLTATSPEGPDVQSVRTLSAKGASRARRRLLGLLLKLPGGDADPAALIARFPDESLLPLRRTGLDPVPQLLLGREPVSRIKMPLGLRGWLITGYEESRAVLAADHDTFSTDFGNMIGKAGIAAEQDPGGLGFADPPAHTRLRHMLTPHFTAHSLERRTERIQQIIDDALDDMEHAGAAGEPVDLLARFALPIPSRVIMELLGVPDDDRAEFQRLSTARFDFNGGAGTSLDVIQESIDYLQKVVVEQRKAPGDGLIGTILAEYGDDVSDVELAGLADGVLTGGLETTASMLALGAIVLLQEPATMAALAAGDGVDGSSRDARVDSFVEEMLRYLSVVQVGFPRFARRDVMIGGKSIFAGDVIICSLSGANRDPRHGAGLGQADSGRPPVGHLAFSHGIHRCVGAELARVELRMAYPALVRRFPGLKLAVAPADLTYREISVVYGVDAVPVTLR